ncbi:cation:proton antiporter subunit C [Alteromonas sp. ASW11-130]|uniref:cation:proton antiporter subunit C n=1 Tax=Alteromonas sp. ASW11-130 TaxID=3015775 RepID=UPI00224232F0|nr:cation:proton antiporter subunit C [Alteromonas sp. ASW11-130]MCW8092760.1 cation:proton antiporter subunit C [Alteromonas sp. ASW11-130]
MSFIEGHLIYWLLICLMMVGLYTLMSCSNLIKKIAGLNVFQTGAILFYVSLGKVTGGTVPIIAEGYESYSNPLPQVLMLTAIVVGVATSALGFALIVRIREAYKSIEEDELDNMDRLDD